MVHWADVQAEELEQQRGDGPHVFATAITPSGPIHVGNMREVLTTEAIFRSAKDRGLPSKLIYIADDYDPLRKVYPFLVENDAGIDYEPYVGMPLRLVPCPCGKHESYSHHFLEPFLRNLADLGIEPEVLSAYDLYHAGRYRDAIARFIDRWDDVRSIIETISKRQLPKHWAPFNAQCPSCGNVSKTQAMGRKGTIFHVTCACGFEGDVDALEPGAGKLPWRLDWPARWQFLGVTFEAFGKDHGASGGSWDTGIPLIRDILGGVEPHHVMYEFLNLKGKGAMHSSSGLAISADDVLQMTPPEVMRYLLMRQNPRKHIDFDPGLGVLNLVDEFDRFERIYFGLEENAGAFSEVERTYQLSCPGDVPASLPCPINYRHLVTIVQMASDLDHVQEILRRQDPSLAFEAADLERLKHRVSHVQYWLRTFAPADVRFQVQRALPDGFTVNEQELQFLNSTIETLRSVDWNGQAIHDGVYAGVEATGLKPGQAFRVLYQAILGQDRGPRAGFFLSNLERDWVLERLQEAQQA